MLNKAVKLARGEDEELVGVSLKLPKSLKEDFEALCKNNGVTMRAMFVSLAKIVVDEEKHGEKIDESNPNFKMYNNLKDEKDEIINRLNSISYEEEVNDGIYIRIPNCSSDQETIKKLEEEQYKIDKQMTKILEGM